jgi:hypothetical protein
MKKDWLTNLVFAFVMALFVGFLVYTFIDARGYSTPYLLPQRILFLPASEQIGDFTGSKTIIYAKEPLSFKGPSGKYTVRGYLKASRPLSAAVGVYVRADEPTCEVLDSSVYVCERGQGDAKATVVEFTNVSFASFCSFDDETYGVVARGKFWIGVEWNPFLPHPLALLLDDLAALKVVSFRPHPCFSTSW